MRVLVTSTIVGIMLGICVVGVMRMVYPDFAALPAATMAPASETGGCGPDVGPRPSCAPGTTTGGAR
jgi:hypothetical protein